ncbi:hypothetical protein [Mycolicibacterium fluoranthenivorans]|uniref:YfhO family protein n=1 Tax=Mycolicibacterium fluoranthenivorans TaxID=258505 RepID=A0A1G4VIB7_9MYCO|nr:hypothetical protein [Mycolicibacterium fluoranthenivorans]SCX07231.1 hypothetical protein SAMN02799620_00991 [Mycolicibacterium fluoranthenivorans]
MRSRLPALDAIVFATLTLAGFSFWFLLGFPYANHNESFAIVAQLKEISLRGAVTTVLEPVANYRPVGQAVAWLGYRAGGTIYPVEIFNYVVAVAAWALLFAAARERKLFAFTALITGGVFFTGYIYLFHLHGVFYSPLLLVTAMLFWVDQDFSRNRLITLTLCTVLAAFFHPYSLLVYLVGLGGMAVQRWRSLAGQRGMIAGALAAAALLLVALLATQTNKNVLTPGDMLDGLLASYRLAEINLIASLVALALTIVTALTLPLGAGPRRVVAVGSGIAGLLFIYTGLPVLLIWIAVCFGKTLLMRKWWMALVLCCSALFPAPTATGSPTYVIFTLMICSAILPYGSTALEERLRAPARRTAAAIIAAASAVLVLLRVGVDVPVVSQLAQPLVAEQEKTFQMEQIARWLVSSKYSAYEPRFVRAVRNPKDASDSIDRTFRPPTNDEDLDMYMRALRGPSAPPPANDAVVLVGFGGDLMPPGALLMTLPSAHAGEARVVLPDNRDRDIR